MNKKQKIIVSITGITIVLLALLGITYAYYLTRIEGNTNTNSISVTTADLKIVYGDGNADLSFTSIMPNWNNESNPKTFTVTNLGNQKVDNYAVYIENIINELSRKDDFVYKITCVSSIESKECNSLNQTTFPKKNGLALTNSLEVNETHSYQLIAYYKEMGVDQSIDMNKKISGKIQIYNINDIVDIQGNVSNFNTTDSIMIEPSNKISQINSDGSYSIIGIEPGNYTIKIIDESGIEKSTNSLVIQKGTETSVNNNTITVTNSSQTVLIDIETNNELKINETIEEYNEFKSILFRDNIVNTPSTTIATQVSSSTEKTFSYTEDDFGRSYYFRGNITNNYVNFANMCWRIVRIRGDNSVKLILEDKNTYCNDTSTNNIDNNESTNYTGNWNIGGGNFGFYRHNAETKTSSNGIKNASIMYEMDFLYGNADTYDPMRTFLKRFQDTLTTEEKNRLNSGDLCYDDSSYITNIVDFTNTVPLTDTEKLDKKIEGGMVYYDSYIRLYSNTTKEPTLKCRGKILNDFGDSSKTPIYAGALTADEAVYAGVKITGINKNMYLINGKTTVAFWTITPSIYYSYYDRAYKVAADGSMYQNGHTVNSDIYDHHCAFRPVIILKPTVSITGGTGTITNPYEVG